MLFFYLFLPFSSKTKRCHLSLRHNSCFALVFKHDDVVQPLVLTQTVQPRHGNIINIALFICILRTVPPCMQVQLFPANSLVPASSATWCTRQPPIHAMFLAANHDFVRETVLYLVVPAMKEDVERSLTII